MKKKNNFKTLFFLAPAFFLAACGGSGDGKSISDLDEDQKEDPCAEMTIEDWDGFLGIYEDTPESEFKNILPGVAHGDYSDDNSSFTYIFDDIEEVSTYVTVNAASGAVEYYNILLNSYSEKELKETQKRMRKNYDIDDCHDQFFMMSQKEIEKIMGDDNTRNDLETGDYWLEYEKGDGMGVHFYFPITDELGCIMIRVFYSY